MAIDNNILNSASSDESVLSTDSEEIVELEDPKSSEQLASEFAEFVNVEKTNEALTQLDSIDSVLETDVQDELSEEKGEVDEFVELDDSFNEHVQRLNIEQSNTKKYTIGEKATRMKEIFVHGTLSSMEMFNQFLINRKKGATIRDAKMLYGEDPQGTMKELSDEFFKANQTDTLDKIDKALTEWTEMFEHEDLSFVEKVVGAAGSSAPFLVPGLGVAALASSVPVIAGGALFLGRGLMAFTEAGMEGGGSYEEAIARGKTEEEAIAIGNKVFYANLPVNYILDSYIFKGFESTKVLKKALKYGKGAVQESAQEGIQQMIQNFFGENSLMSGVGESAAIGGVLGFGTSTLLPAASQAIIDKEVQEELSVAKATAERFRDNVDLVDDYVSIEETKKSLLNELGGRVESIDATIAKEEVKRKAGRKIVNEFFREGLKPERAALALFDWKDGSTGKKVFYDNFEEASQNEYANLTSTSRRVQEIWKDIDLTKMYDRKYTFTREVVDKKTGKRTKATRTHSMSEMVAMYANSFNENNRNYLLGVTDPNTGEVNGGIGITDVDLAAIEEAIPMDIKNAVSNMFDFYSEVEFPRLEAFVKKEFGMNLTKEMFYDPLLSVESADAETSVLSGLLNNPEFRKSYLNTSEIKNRTGAVGGSLKTIDYFGNMMKHLQNTEHLLSHYKAVKTAQAALDTKEIREAMETKDLVLTDQIRDFVDTMKKGQLTHSNGALNKASDFIRHNASASILWFNMMSIAKQPISIFAGQHGIKSKYLLKSTYDMMTDPTIVIKKMYNESTYMTQRKNRMELTFAEWAKSDQFKEMFDVKSWEDSSRELGLSGIQGMDTVTVATLWTAKKMEVMDKTGNEKYAIKQADRNIRKTQPSARLVDLTAHQRKRGFVGALTAFTSQLSNNYNLMYEVGANWKHTEHKAGAIMSYWIAPTLIMGALLKGYNLKDLWEDPESLIPLATGSVLGPIPGVNVVSGIASQELANTIRDARGKTKSPVFKASGLTPVSLMPFMKMAEINKPLTMLSGALQLRGLPSTQPIRTFKGASQLWKGETDDLRVLIMNEKALEQPRYKTQRELQAERRAKSGIKKFKF